MPRPTISGFTASLLEGDGTDITVPTFNKAADAAAVIPNAVIDALIFASDSVQNALQLVARLTTASAAVLATLYSFYTMYLA